MTWNQQQEEADAEEKIDRCVKFSDHVALVVSERKRALGAWQKAQQLQAELDALKAAHAWIKTSERAPDETCDVLGVVDGVVMHLDYSDDEDAAYPWADDYMRVYADKDVSHWQFLPEPPK